MKQVFITSGARTPIGSFMGALSDVAAPKLCSYAIKKVVQENNLSKDMIDEVIIGQVLQGGVGQAPARQAALQAGLLSKTPCTTVNKVCGSGLKAVMMASQSIALKQSHIVIAGGMESMSNAPYFSTQARLGLRMGNSKLIDLMIHDGLFDPYDQSHMGNFGDMCAREHKISREQQDEFAHQSYEFAQTAQEKRCFDAEITPVIVKSRREEKTILSDEEPGKYRPQKMAVLKPIFDANGTVTVANASKINDGAAALVVACQEKMAELNTPNKFRIAGYATHASDPQWFTTAPVGAIKKVLGQCQLTIKDIDLFEINEAFSVVALYAMDQLDIKRDRLNIHGGAVALGHPIGCSGARVLVTLMHALTTHNKQFGLASLCLGGGEAVAMIIERAH